MEYKISFFGSDNHAGIDWDTDSTHDDYKASPNGSVYIMWGMSDKNYEKYYLIVFDKEQVFYKKGFSSDLCIDLNNLYVMDDKTSILVADDYILYLNEKGENISRKNIAHNNEYGISQHYFWCSGEKENGDNCILVIDLNDRSTNVKKTPYQDTQGYNNGVFWCFGENDEQESELFIFDFSSNKAIKRVINDLPLALSCVTLNVTALVFSSFVFTVARMSVTLRSKIEPSEPAILSKRPGF